MKIVIDDKIPYIRDVIAQICDDATYVKGSAISAADVRDADALIVRTRTRCDRQLLKGSRVKFVATATIGFDHIDALYLKEAGIEWMNCPGCNSASVAQYLRSVLILLRRERGVDAARSTVGVVGYGHVGSKVARVAQEEGFRVLVCDPPLAEKAKTTAAPGCADSHAGTINTDADIPADDFVSMERIEQECDVITFHVPLTREGTPHPTLHIADEAFFARLRRRPVIVNTSRGAVVDNAALLHALESGAVSDAVIDTWEGEPDINVALLNKVYIGTPHIAGYSADGKTNADNMVIAGLCRHFGIANRWHILPPPLPPEVRPTGQHDTDALRLYNPLDDSRRLKASPESFEQLRGDYPLRRETF